MLDFKMVFSDSQALVIYDYVRNNPDSKIAENLKLRRDATGLTQQSGANREILSELGMNDSAAYSFTSDIIHTGRAYKEVSSSN
jgi:hypothetical protein